MEPALTTARKACSVIVLLASTTALAAADKPKLVVREIVENVASTHSREGVVTAIDATGLTLVEIDDGKEAEELHIVPVDRLRTGGLLDNYSADYAYRWQDVKKGDSIRVDAMWDKSDGKLYCLAIKLQRRPGEKLPKSQNPKDDSDYKYRSVCNDIENGVDVSDEDFKKAFPQEFEVDGKTGERTPLPPCKIETHYRKKLDAIRAKKGQELKATPPKKDDKK